jgi:hypothetical protein
MRTSIIATVVVAAALALAATAAARPIQDSPINQPPPAPAPRTVTIVRHTDDTLPIALASCALLVAMASAGLTIVRRPVLRPVE